MLPMYMFGTKLQWPTKPYLVALMKPARGLWAMTCPLEEKISLYLVISANHVLLFAMVPNNKYWMHLSNTPLFGIFLRSSISTTPFIMQMTSNMQPLSTI